MSDILELSEKSSTDLDVNMNAIYELESHNDDKSDMASMRYQI